MKRTERHHLKQNELQTFARETRERFESKRRETLMIVGAVGVIAVLAVGYFAWRDRVQTKASATPAFRAMMEALMTTADAYPSTEEGLHARYQEASTWMALGDPAKAAAAYQQVVDKAGNRIYGQMARLGLAETQAVQGQYDTAINTYKEMAQRKDGPLPVDGILMQLGRTYLDAGKQSDAQQTFNRLVEEFPDSPFTADAKRALDSMKKT